MVLLLNSFNVILLLGFVVKIFLMKFNFLIFFLFVESFVCSCRLVCFVKVFIVFIWLDLCLLNLLSLLWWFSNGKSNYINENKLIYN